MLSHFLFTPLTFSSLSTLEPKENEWISLNHSDSRGNDQSPKSIRTIDTILQNSYLKPTLLTRSHFSKLVRKQSLSPPQTIQIRVILFIPSFLRSVTHIKPLGNSTFPRFKPAIVFIPAILIDFILDHGTTTAWSTPEYCQIPQLT